MTVTPFLAKVGDQVVVVLGFTDALTPMAICAGKGLRLFRLDDLEIIRAARDWPRPENGDPAVEQLWGSRERVMFGDVSA